MNKLIDYSKFCVQSVCGTFQNKTPILVSCVILDQMGKLFFHRSKFLENTLEQTTPKLVQSL